MLIARFSFARLILITAVVFLITLTGNLFGQTLSPGPQVLTFFSDVDDTEQPYGLYLPPGFDAAKEYPLVVSLHGAGSNHRLNLRRVFGKSNSAGETDVEASRYFPEWADVDYIVATPYARGTMGYQGVAEKDVMDVIEDVKRRFRIDENRMYLTGLSMGGGGTLWIGLTRPDLWAAIAPVCPAPPQETADLAQNALNIPVHFFQGGADPVVRPEGTRAWVQRLKDLGVQVEYEEFPGVGHDSWVQAYEGGRIFDWFSQHKRNPFPDQVRFSTTRYKYNDAYWVRFDRLTPGTLASIDAAFTAPNRIEISTTDLDGFTLHLAGHPRFNRENLLEVRIDGRAVETPAADSVSFCRMLDGWISGKCEQADLAKRPGSEGPMSEVIESRHIYVYGTEGDPSPEESQARYAQAARAAEWSVNRGWFMGRVMVFPRLLADSDVRPSDLETSNLVLFGTKETNSLIAQFSDRLPIEFSGSDTEYGLVYVYPAGERVVLISSGLPWWQPPEDGSTGQGGRSSPFTNQVPAFWLSGRGDYLLFKGSADNIIAEGRFDQNWRLPAADAEKMLATGAVTVKDDAIAGVPR